MDSQDGDTIYMLTSPPPPHPTENGEIYLQTANSSLDSVTMKKLYIVKVLKSYTKD